MREPVFAPAGPANTRSPLVYPHDDGDISPSHALLPRLQIGRSDYLELGDLTTKYRAAPPSPALRFLERELSRAVVVDDRRLPANVATLRSQVAFHDEETGRDWVMTLGHTADFLSREDAISVLSPLGPALIGLSEGQSIAFDTADQRSRRVGLVKVLCQPSRFAWGRAAALGRWTRAGPGRPRASMRRGPLRRLRPGKTNEILTRGKIHEEHITSVSSSPGRDFPIGDAVRSEGCYVAWVRIQPGGGAFLCAAPGRRGHDLSAVPFRHPGWQARDAELDLRVRADEATDH